MDEDIPAKFRTWFWPRFGRTLVAVATRTEHTVSNALTYLACVLISAAWLWGHDKAWAQEHMPGASGKAYLAIMPFILLPIYALIMTAKDGHAAAVAAKESKAEETNAANNEREEMRRIADRVTTSMARLNGEHRILQERQQALLTEHREILVTNNRIVLGDDGVISDNDRATWRLRNARTDLMLLILDGETLSRTLLGTEDPAIREWIARVLRFADFAFGEELLCTFQDEADISAVGDMQQRRNVIVTAARFALERLTLESLSAAYLPRDA